MSELKATPGPWKCGREPFGLTTGIYASGGDSFNKSLGRIWTGNDEYEANAHLIAAAPALYAAGVECFEHMEWSSEQGRAAYEAMKSALSLALGESPNA